MNFGFSGKGTARRLQVSRTVPGGKFFTLCFVQTVRQHLRSNWSDGGDQGGLLGLFRLLGFWAFAAKGRRKQNPLPNSKQADSPGQRPGLSHRPELQASSSMRRPVARFLFQGSNVPKPSLLDFLELYSTWMLFHWVSGRKS